MNEEFPVEKNTKVRRKVINEKNWKKKIRYCNRLNKEKKSNHALHVDYEHFPI